ncbi:M10 family metallopeptidase C-terminal domain-containing protein [Yoonia sp. SS1-5]|uniref:M10 family metallopeptidase C-terminal domain-containing protein n=1 Tax=Yoonia rhodophyticola TaxID=3137370 RepID=A0AAN0MBZ2_9RHOB
MNETFSDSLEVDGDRDWIRFSVDTAQYVQVNLASDQIIDTYLRVFDSSGRLVTEDDDIVDGVLLESQVTFLAQPGEQYFLSAAAFFDAGVGDYELTVTPGARPLLQTLQWGTRWNDPNIAVYFAPLGTTYNDAGGYVSDGWTEYEQQQFQLAFDALAAVANINFEVTTNPREADFRIIIDDDQVQNRPRDEDLLGFFYTPLNDEPSTGMFNRLGYGWDDTPGGGLEQGGYGFVTILHELMHGLGLAHPHDDGGNSQILRDVTSDSGDYGAYNLNQGLYTAMTYNTGFSERFPNADNTVEYGFEYQPMALDIATMQYLYGANMDTATGDDTYTLASANASGTGWASIWDAGGIDEIVSTSTANTVIDLRAATLEYEIGGGGFVSAANGIRGGFTIAIGVVIENARSGNGNDTITGNHAANTLNAAGGNDRIDGRHGDDTINGGAGRDQISGGAGVDQIDGGVGADAISGNGGHDIITDTSGANVIHGNSGDDTITAGGTLYGGTGNDTLTGQGSPDILFGGRGVDILQGGAGDDRLDGGMDGDSLEGGAGADIFVFSFISDSFATTTGRDTILDFEIGTDLIDLSNIDANRAEAGDQAFTFVDLPTPAPGEIWVTEIGIDSIVEADRNGDGIADLQIVLGGVTGITADDFIL